MISNSVNTFGFDQIKYIWIGLVVINVYLYAANNILVLFTKLDDV